MSGFPGESIARRANFNFVPTEYGFCKWQGWLAQIRGNPGPKTRAQARAARARGLHLTWSLVSFTMRKAALVTMCVILTAPAAHAQVVTRVARATEKPTPTEIAQARDQYVAAFNAGEPEKIVPLYTEDALVIPSDGVFLRGKTEVARYFADALQQPTAGGAVTITPLAVTTAGDLGSETGSFEESRTTTTGTRVQVTGVYVIIYTRGADGCWRIAMEVRSSGDSHALVQW